MFSEEEDGVCRSQSSRHWSDAGAQMGCQCIFKVAKCVFFSHSACTGPNCDFESVLCNSEKFPRLSASSVHVPSSSHKSHLVTVNYSIVVRLRGDWWVWRHPALPPPLRQADEIVWHDVIPRVQSKLYAGRGSLISPRLHRVRRRRKVEGSEKQNVAAGEKQQRDGESGEEGLGEKKRPSQGEKKQQQKPKCLHMERVKLKARGRCWGLLVRRNIRKNTFYTVGSTFPLLVLDGHHGLTCYHGS